MTNPVCIAPHDISTTPSLTKTLPGLLLDRNYPVPKAPYYPKPHA